MSTRSAGPRADHALLGRANERALLDGLIAAIRRGESRSLVLRGEAGIGKTALLDYLVESASDLTVLRSVGVESEMELAYASLEQVCGPMLARLPKLPSPQRRALEIVFGLSDGAPPDRFLVGVAVLSLLSDLADERPLLCVVDDAQWLDQASALTLAFVARRLLADPVAMVFAAREPGEELGQLPELEVSGLLNGDARALLGSALRVRLDERVRDRFIAETHGNPLALLELPRDLTVTQLAGGFGLLGGHTPPGRVEESFVRRLKSLSDDAQRLLLLAAAEPLGDPVLLLNAAERIGITVPAVYRDTDGLLSLEARVTFRHPLVRSAVYRAAGTQERRAVHLALAEATDRVRDPDRRAWHLAAAATGPDEAVALELEHSAGRAQARGGVAATAAFLERAVALTGDPARRADRALGAAEASVLAGAFDAAFAHLATARAGSLDEVQRARADLVRGQVAFASGQGSDAPPLLLSAARRLEPTNMDLARETYLTACGAAVFAGAAGGCVLDEICRTVQALPPPAGPPRPLDLLLDGLALLITSGHAAAAATMQRAAKALTDIPVEDVLRWGWMATTASAAVWDDEGFRAISARQLQLVRGAGALAELPLYLAQLGLAQTLIGEFASAASLVAEADSVATATGTAIAPYTALRLRSLQGREDQAAAVIASAVEHAAAGGHAMAASWAHWAGAVLYNGLGRYDEATSAALKVTSDAPYQWPSMWALPELVEAAARTGMGELARDALGRLEATTQPSGTDFAVGIEARSRALVSDGEGAEDLYREAIERLSRTRLRPELARAHLLYGEWLRREQRRLDAREQLRAAHTLFRSIGMEAFDERARKELLATGEKLRKRTAKTRDELTDQERQIAHLAGEGLSNAEIGTRLFLSPRTVEWHLRKVFTKLGIRSRQRLSAALSNSDSNLLPA